MTDRKFFKTVIKFTVLSEEPIPEGMNPRMGVYRLGLENIANECMDGSWSMGNASNKETELNGKQAAEALLNQASDPSFFNLTEDGEDAD